VTIGDFEAALDENLERLHRELRDETYQPQAVRRLEIPKRGSPGKSRALGIPSVYDRICQQALANRLEPIFEKVFDPSSFGYRKGRKTADALTKIWREVEAGNEWIVDADLKDYFGSVDHDRLMTLIGKQVADSRVLIGAGDVFSKGRDFAAWLGLVPKQISTGDRTILGKISKRGNRYLRVLFVQAAGVVLIKPKSWERHGLKS
jgi:retron-type reverse transcriptase